MTIIVASWSVGLWNIASVTSISAICPSVFYIFILFFLLCSFPFRPVSFMFSWFPFLVVSVIFVISRLSSFPHYFDFPIIQIFFTFIFRLFWSPAYDLQFVSIFLQILFSSNLFLVIFTFLFFVYPFSYFLWLRLHSKSLLSVIFRSFNSPLFSEFPFILVFFIFVIFHIFKSLLLSVIIHILQSPFRDFDLLQAP